MMIKFTKYNLMIFRSKERPKRRLLLRGHNGHHHSNEKADDLKLPSVAIIIPSHKQRNSLGDEWHLETFQQMSNSNEAGENDILAMRSHMLSWLISC